MKELAAKTVSYYYESDNACIILGDSFKILRKLKAESIDMIFADPPYFLSNDGITCQGGRMVSVNKASWDKIEFEELELLEDVDRIENNGNSGIEPSQIWYTCYLVDGTEFDFYG